MTELTTCRSDLRKQRRERQAKRTSDRVVDADREGGSDFSMREWESFGKVDGWYGADAYSSELAKYRYFDSRLGSSPGPYRAEKRYMNKAISGTLASFDLGIKKQQPAASRHQAMLGNVKSSRLRLPKVSMA